MKGGMGEEKEEEWGVSKQNGKNKERKLMERWRRKEEKIGAHVGGRGEEEDAQNEEW